MIFLIKERENSLLAAHTTPSFSYIIVNVISSPILKYILLLHVESWVNLKPLIVYILHLYIFINPYNYVILIYFWIDLLSYNW